MAACLVGARQECLATLSAEGREQEFGGAQTHVLVGHPRSEGARAEMWPVQFGVSLPDFLARAEHTVAALSICMDLVFSVFFCSRLLFAPLPPPFPSVLLPGPQTYQGSCALEAIHRCPHPRVTAERWIDTRPLGRQLLCGCLSVPWSSADKALLVEYAGFAERLTMTTVSLGNEIGPGEEPATERGWAASSRPEQRARQACGKEGLWASSVNARTGNGRR